MHAYVEHAQAYFEYACACKVLEHLYGKFLCKIIVKLIPHRLGAILHPSLITIKGPKCSFPKTC